MQLMSLYIGVIIFALVVGEFASIVQHMDMAAAKFQDMFNATNEYMRAKNLPSELRDQVRDFIQIRFESHKMYDEQTIMLNLPPLIRQKILLHNTKDVFDRVPIFKCSPLAARLTLSSALTPLTMFPGDTVFEIGTTAESCYFIYNGQVEIFLPSYAVGISEKARKALGSYGTMAGTEDLTCATLSNGCYFGDAGVVLDYSPKRSASARVGPDVAHCDLYVIEKSRLRDFGRDYPALWAHLCLIAARRLARVRHRQGLLAQLCPLFKIDVEDLKASQLYKQSAHDAEQAAQLYKVRQESKAGAETKF